MLEKSLEAGYQLSKSEVARETGVSFATVQRWFDGEFDRLDAGTLFALMDYFGVEFDDLIERID